MSSPVNPDFLILAVQFVVAFAIAIVSLVGYRMFGSRTLFRMALSFFFIGGGILVQDTGNIATELAGFGNELLILGLVLEALGYFILAISHIYTVRSEVGAEVSSMTLLLPFFVAAVQPSTALVLEGVARSVSFFLLLYILSENIIFLIKNRNAEALLPIVGFGLLLASIFIRLFFILPTETSDLVDLLKLAGFLILSGPVLVLLVRLRGGPP